MGVRVKTRSTGLWEEISRVGHHRPALWADDVERCSDHAEKKKVACAVEHRSGDAKARDLLGSSRWNTSIETPNRSRHPHIVLGVSQTPQIGLVVQGHRHSNGQKLTYGRRR